MKYLIFSDTHGDRAEFQEILNHYRDNPEIAAIFYNGDSQFESDDPSWENIHVVLGNMDLFSSDFPIENVYKNKTDDITIYQTHGHLAHVNNGFEKLDRLANKHHADIVLFGHTHVILAEKYNGRLFINPGSTTYPRGPQRSIGGTYVILTINKSEFIVEYFSRSFKEIPFLRQVFSR
ncbi:putative hosphoesterase [Oenococcus oeni]|uniref:Phosphoesterase n=1 Tax=Oenococcus oeni TaxID=1247 RepID=A0AAQ2UV78_OENOE|nr:metallophosphoesterase [Oenococcus oeni]OIL38610.1 YfcE family phosphodiesterase [Oenococcus oeni]OLQ40730.1 YfcE family phosphodiesterase [Oenococcus oeni]SYW05714.1 putative hosphoesterase [Oenococcus oeni]VDB97714.1 putative hosphoesterase [Oenococcus oeni]